ncbi:MAG: hypothetical protein QOH72_3156, partial [Solirubrobacteraceae bacterium]|nr:hypothetical protein [Solirubrobacteraceae bacterium]
EFTIEPGASTTFTLRGDKPYSETTVIRPPARVSCDNATSEIVTDFVPSF